MTQKDQLIEMLKDARCSFWEDRSGGVVIQDTRFVFSAIGQLADVEYSPVYEDDEGNDLFE